MVKCFVHSHSSGMLYAKVIFMHLFSYINCGIRKQLTFSWTVHVGIVSCIRNVILYIDKKRDVNARVLKCLSY